MPWVRFDRDFDWNPPQFKRRWSRRFPAGLTWFVTRACAAAAAEEGRGAVVPRPAGRTAPKGLT